MGQKTRTAWGARQPSHPRSIPRRPKYDQPIKQITDLAGIRIITQVLGTIPEIDELLRSIDVLEQSDKGKELIEKDLFGYQSIHYLVRINVERARLAEYERYQRRSQKCRFGQFFNMRGLRLNTISNTNRLQRMPREIKRRFMALAGMLEVADREFQAIQGAEKRIVDTAREMVNRGDLAESRLHRCR